MIEPGNFNECKAYAMHIMRALAKQYRAEHLLDDLDSTSAILILECCKKAETENFKNFKGYLRQVIRTGFWNVVRIERTIQNPRKNDATRVDLCLFDLAEKVKSVRDVCESEFEREFVTLLLHGRKPREVRQAFGLNKAEFDKLGRELLDRYYQAKRQ